MRVVHEGLQIYHVYECDINSFFNNVEYPMIKYNEPKAFLPMQLHNQDGSETVYYEVTGRISVAHWGENHIISYDVCMGFLQNLYQLICSVEEYMLSMEQISFKKEDVFINTEKQLQWMYFPEKTGEVREELEAFFLWMLSAMDYDDKQALDLIYSLFRSMKKDSILKDCLHDILYKTSEEAEEHKEVICRDLDLDKDMEESGKKEKNGRIKRVLITILGCLLALISLLLLVYDGYSIHENGASLLLNALLCLYLIIFLVSLRLIIFCFSGKNNVVAEENEEADHDRSDMDERGVKDSHLYREKNLYEGRSNKKSKDYSDKRTENATAKSIFEELEEHWEDGGETILLYSSAERKFPILQSEKEGVRIELQVFPFYIGSEEGLNQLPLKNKAVSRQHAVITAGRDSSYYLEDLDSKNGTKVDGLPVVPEKPVLLGERNIICFANENWIFSLS